MNRVRPIYELTLEMQELLDQRTPMKEREKIITKLNELVLQRGTCMDSVRSPYTEEEKQLGAQLIPLNEYVQNKMQLLFGELKVEMKQVKKQKSSNKKYVNPYQNVQIMDGMYMDKKK
ncbi:flagellar protein FliT [Oceanobacillus bengalensis]|uniref:Flagellar protein FliT n=1 Tax=Oceanobacillus bengalensis TaxID=1435466 RepID=A0A494Z6P7_9BACI|nr:flagellar protein FliT [Oceanobacillus bengalensis]RKQ18223.1 flagellar protein FliT [Oceanobacillus bengalensis]